MPSSEVLLRARDYWMNGEDIEAGRLIFESLPWKSRPLWAANFLRLVVRRTGTTSNPIERILDLVDHPEDWSKAHRVFDELRDANLGLPERCELSRQQLLLIKIQTLAELVAKVTYNATEPDDEFDEDSGWWIATCLRDVLDDVNDDEFSTMMESVLSSNVM